MRSLLQLLIFVSIFLLMWWGFSSITWVETFHIQKFTREKQEQLSELLLKLHSEDKEEVKKKEILDKVNNLVRILCEKSHIDTATIKIHVFEDKMVNAFAMPGGHIIVNTELINSCDAPDMLAGVIGHEIAHVQLDHVSRKLSRELGMGTLLVLTGGGEHLGGLKKALSTLSSRSFDRDMEREADRWAVMYLKNAKGDPRQLAFFLQKLSNISESEIPDAFQWISTHPETRERVQSILRDIPDNTATVEMMDKEEWEELKALVKELDAD